MTARRPPAAVHVAGCSVTVRDGRVYEVDQEPERDPGLTPAQARAKAAALNAAAAQAERDGVR